jgi:hypothetical protein
VISFITLCAFGLACYGWGGVAYALFYPERPPYHAFFIALGIAVLSVIGGLLNVTHMASRPALMLCLFCGMLLGISFIVQFGRHYKWRWTAPPYKLPELFYSILILGCGIFLVVTLSDSSIFNFHDDFLNYLPRVTRMQQIGTVGGNPFEVLGLTDFGVQNFFQAVISVWLPIQSAFSFDTIFCFVLGLYLIIEHGRLNKCAPAVIVLAMIIFIIINPQIVNLSSVYPLLLLP